MKKSTEIEDSKKPKEEKPLESIPISKTLFPEDTTIENLLHSFELVKADIQSGLLDLDMRPPNSEIKPIQEEWSEKKELEETKIEALTTKKPSVQKEEVAKGKSILSQLNESNWITIC